MKESETLSFWTTGEDMTSLIRNFWNEGAVYNAVGCFGTSNENVPKNLLWGILLGTHKLVGDTRDEDGLFFEDDNSQSECKTLPEITFQLEDSYIKSDRPAAELIRHLDTLYKTFYNSSLFQKEKSLLEERDRYLEELDKDDRISTLEWKIQLLKDEQKGEIQEIESDGNKSILYGSKLEMLIRGGGDPLEDFFKRNREINQLADIETDDTPEEASQKMLDNVWNPRKYDEISNEEYEQYKDKRYTPSGTILADGRVILCDPGEHSTLFDDLRNLGLSSSSSRFECDKTISFSNMLINCGLGGDLNNIRLGGSKISNITDHQIKSLLYMSDRGLRMYSGNKRIPNCVRILINNRLGMGTKYGNLQFLDQFYQEDFNIPDFRDMESWIRDLESPYTFNNIKFTLRTSLLKQLPGVFDSYFDLENTNAVLEKLELFKTQLIEFQKEYPDTKAHAFLQWQVDGLNGVAHIDKENGFRYSANTKRGVIVDGGESNIELNVAQLEKLKKAALRMSNIFKKPLQIEFSFEDHKLYIIEYKIIKSKPTTMFYSGDRNILYKGKCFVSQNFNETVIGILGDDILVISEDISNNMEIFGKKAIIVENDVEFSHALTLASTLQIPAIYATGPIQLGKRVEIKSSHGLIFEIEK